ncbi:MULTISPECIES: hypothetical protein [unclassified Rhizobium]|uniref:hypothetical protein n=1 Tax=unclassified Rhizobium TaxID=2613769 RepID=UPI00115DC522|nr:MULTISPECIES: hypothetical protein [unclassified Rhizobium]TQX88447.1 hypothetical protein EQW76_11460 [Rhizobium sp. rho-13.1]TQY12642.1 hypothetical protein EQW74_15105 [Rhizobium sp. rho-1.1]
MPTIADIREKYPQYHDMSDGDLASALHKKFYSDMPEEQFNAKIGFSSQPSTPPPPSAAGEPGIAGSIDAFGRGIVNAATFGFGDEIGAAVDAAGSHLPWRDPKTYDQALADGRNSDKAVAAAHPVSNIAGNVAGAVGAGTGLARSGLSLTARAADAGAGIGRTTLASAIDGGIAGGVQGFGQGEGTDNRLHGAMTGAESGGALGTALPLALSGVVNSVRRTVSPFTINPERQALVDQLGNEGVRVTAGQATGNRGLRYAESEIGGQQAEDAMSNQGEQFTSAILRRVGVNADRATPDVVDHAFTQNSNQFNQVTAANTLVPDRQLSTDFVDHWREYMQLTPPSQRAPIVANTMRDINNALTNGGTLDGATYQALRSRLARAARGTADPQLGQALNGMRDALDDGMERSIAATNPNDLGVFRDARNTYRNLLVVEKAATGAGENAAQGLISPSSLRNATIASQGRRQYARGQGDFAELARAGEGVMKPLPNSGTAGRLNAQNLGTTFLGALGGIAGTTAGGAAMGVGGAVAGAAIPKIVGRMMMSEGGQAYLRNQLLTGNLSAETRASLINAISQIDANAIPRILGQDPRPPLEVTVTPRRDGHVNAP